MAEISGLWDFDDPAGSERRFREALAQEQEHDQILELKTQLARSLGLQKRFEEGHAMLDEVDAVESRSPRPRIRALLERGRLINSSGHRHESREPFLAAYELACNAHEDALAVDAAHMLGIVSLDPDEQIEWNRVAIERAANSPDPEAQRWAPSIMNNLGWTYHERGENENAFELFTTALVLREARGEPGPIRVAKYAVGHTLRSMGRSEEALEILLDAHSGFDGEDGYLEEEIGEALMALDRWEEAVPYLQRAVTMHQKDPWAPPAQWERIQQVLESLSLRRCLSYDGDA